MPLDLYLPRDIRNVLRALSAASEATLIQVSEVLSQLDSTAEPVKVVPAARDAEAMLNYQRGYQAALLDVGIAVGLEISEISRAALSSTSQTRDSLAELFAREVVECNVQTGTGRRV